MSNWKLYTPDGTTELLPNQCADKTNIENVITEVFTDFGYNVVETPVMQFYDAYKTENGKIGQEMMYKFFDRDGRILVLRPDITTCIARMVSTKLNDGIFPKRLYYSGKVFRYAERLYDVSCEFCQAGIELIGVKNDAADAEVISCAIESLLRAGLESFQIEIGQTEFYKGLSADAGLSAQDSESLCALIDKKDSFAVEQFIKPMEIEPHIKEMILKLTSLFGDIEILNDIDTNVLGEKSRTALKNLKSVYSILSEYGFEKYISIDLSLVKGINSYTGIIFKGITYGMGYDICSGGRYDALCGEFGSPMAAVGMAIETDRLVSVLSAGTGECSSPLSSDLLMFGANNALKYKLACAIRRDGYTVEDYIMDNSYENALEYAKKAGISGVISVLHNEDKLMIYNIKENTSSYTDLCEFLDE